MFTNFISENLHGNDGFNVLNESYLMTFLYSQYVKLLVMW